MGRHAKRVAGPDGHDRRELGYYSTPRFVADFLARRALEIRPSARTVLDPCVGRGELIAPLAEAGLHVTGIDIVDRKPALCAAVVIGDFLELSAGARPGDLFSEPSVPQADIVMANPPYNCHETDYIRKNKSALIEVYGKATALNMYSLFIRAIIENAKADGVIAMVVHDSFLTAVGHRELREFILDQCCILDLHLCPTSLFLDQGADVRTCLVVLKKGRRDADPVVRVSNRPATVREFRNRLAAQDFVEMRASDLTLSSDVDHREFVIGVPNPIRSLFSDRRVMDVAPCITGVSTGNDREYLRSSRAVGYTVPFYKNPASRKFYAEPDAYIVDNYLEVDRKVSNFMVRNKDLISRGGLSCSSMGVAFGATVRPEGTLCGVNPNVIVGEDDKWWLLSYLNSRLCLYLLRGVLIRSNMVTAGYASRIPVPVFDKWTKRELTSLGMQAFEVAQSGGIYASQLQNINQIIEGYLGLDPNTVNSLQTFEADAVRLT